jgi:diketogulonate reductase-like aldo/keto reductase
MTMDRRGFLGASVGALAAACGRQAPREGEVPTVTAAESKAEMPRRKLGRTGVEVSAIGIGGYHIGIPQYEADSIAIVHRAIDRGVTFLDNCWDYHDGKSELLMGRALKGNGRRERVFLMSKIDGRTKAAAAGQIDQSLKRLGTDRIDLIQIHEVIRPNDPKRCFEEGCIQALLDAKKAGKLRFIGFTGHKDPDIHNAMLDAADKHGFRFDTVQMPLNVLDAHYRSFEKNVLPRLVKNGIGVLGMKPLCAGKALDAGVRPIECLHYAMNLPTSVVITGCDSIGVLDQAILAALTFRPLPPADVDRLLSKTAKAARDGGLEEFKTTTKHDGTIKSPKWLEKAEI